MSEQCKRSSARATIITEQWMKSQYPKPASCVFVSSATPLLPLDKCWKERVRALNKNHTHARTHTGNIQLSFQHLLSKAPGVTSLKKTQGWNLTLLLALRGLKPSSCHCDRHYCCISNGGLANVGCPLGTSPSPPALFDRRAIYLSASSSTPSLPNPFFCQRDMGSHGDTQRHITSKSIKEMAVEGTWGAQEQVSVVNECNHPLTRVYRKETWQIVLLLLSGIFLG